jgi:hypothetical protein
LTNSPQLGTIAGLIITYKNQSDGSSTKRFVKGFVDENGFDCHWHEQRQYCEAKESGVGSSGSGRWLAADGAGKRRSSVKFGSGP